MDPEAARQQNPLKEFFGSLSTLHDGQYLCLL